MKVRNLENTLALLGAFIVIVGVSAAASSALADEAGNVEITAPVTQSHADVDRVISASAAQAANAATVEAISAVSQEIQLELDIRLLGRTSLMSSKP